MVMEFIQAARQYEQMNLEEKKQFINNVADTLLFTEEDVQQVILEYFYHVSEDLGERLKKRLNF